MTIWRWRRDGMGASVIEYALLLAMVLLVVFASVYALGRTPDRPASVLGDTFSRQPDAGPSPGSSTPTTSTTTTTTTTTTEPPLPSPP